MTRLRAESLMPKACVIAGSAGWMKLTPIISAMLEAKTSVRARRFDGASSPRPKRMGRESTGMAAS